MSNPLPSHEPEFAALVGFDWGDRNHHWALHPANANDASSRGRLENTPEAIELWAAQLNQCFGGRPGSRAAAT